MKRYDRAPTIETERLLLDGHREEDFERFAAMWADPDVTQHIGKPSSATESWSRLLRYAGLWPLLGYGFWAVRDRADGRFLGELGYADFRREITPPMTGIPEAGWVFTREAHGRGVAGEALAAAHGWLDGAGIARSFCIIAPQNARSRRLGERHGYRLSRTIQFRDEPTLLLERRAGHV